MITSYTFGRIEINGRLYTSDVLIFPDGRVQDSWWRQSGHRLAAEDLAGLIAARPEMIIAGTGASGLMRPTPGLAEELAQRDIRFLALPSAAAMEQVNEFAGTLRLAACFHLTC